MTVRAIKKEYFSTWQEASVMCIEARVKGVVDYYRRYKQISSKLPSNPWLYYKDWPGWKAFLGKK